jgi:hypothetical protein
LCNGVLPWFDFEALANSGLFCDRIIGGLDTEPGTLSESEALGARIAVPARDIRKSAEGFLIVDGTGMLDLLVYGSAVGCMTDRLLESIVNGIVRGSGQSRTRRGCSQFV